MTGVKSRVESWNLTVTRQAGKSEYYFCFFFESRNCKRLCLERRFSWVDFFLSADWCCCWSIVVLLFQGCQGAKVQIPPESMIEWVSDFIIVFHFNDALFLENKNGCKSIVALAKGLKKKSLLPKEGGKRMKERERERGGAAMFVANWTYW